MRFVMLSLMMIAFSTPVAADDAKDTLCRERADLVIDAFNARLDGDNKRKVRRNLRKALDRQAGDLLAEFIFSVPEENLTEDEISAAGDRFYDQCKAL